MPAEFIGGHPENKAACIKILDFFVDKVACKE